MIRDFTIRELTGVEELRQAEDLQLQVWGRDSIPESRDLLRAMQSSGGFVAGAFREGEMVGFCWGFPTRDASVLHSHRLGVPEKWRSQGVGAALKEFQRDWCRENGYRSIHWTVDPLRAANAELNYHRLGAISRRYLVDFYGEMDGLDSFMPSDRLLVEWDVQVDRRPAPTELADSELYPQAVLANEVRVGRPRFAAFAPQTPLLIVQIPADIHRVTAEDRALALLWRVHIRELLLALLEDGYTIIDYLRNRGSALVLSRESPTP